MKGTGDNGETRDKRRTRRHKKGKRQRGRLKGQAKRQKTKEVGCKRYMALERHNAKKRRAQKW